MERYNGSEPVNIGTGSEISIKDLMGIIKEVTGFGGELIWDVTKPDGQPRRRLDTSRALNEFGFKSKTALQEGLVKTVEWFRSQVTK